MTPQEIRDAIAASAELQAFAAARNDAAIAVSLSAGKKKSDPSTKFTSLGIAEKFPSLNGLPGPLAAEIILQKIEGFATAALASQDPVTALLGASTQRQMQHLTNNGMAIGSPAIAAMLAVMVQAGALTQPEVDALVSVAAVDDPVSVNEVSFALSEVQ
jgi:hypothetical protein